MTPIKGLDAHLIQGAGHQVLDAPSSCLVGGQGVQAIAQQLQHRGLAVATGPDHAGQSGIELGLQAVEEATDDGDAVDGALAG